MVKTAIDKEFEVTADKIKKYSLIEKVGDPGEELEFINKSKVNDMNADINHIDIGYLRLIYKRIKVLENGWILCGVGCSEYTDILDSELNPLYKVAATLEVKGTGLGYVEKVIDRKIRENEEIARIFNDCGNDLDDNGVKTVIVGEYNARDTLIGMTEIIRITCNVQDSHCHKDKYHLETTNLFDDYGQQISGIDHSDCVIYSVIPVERPIGIENIYIIQTYNFDTNRFISYTGIEQYGVIRIIGRYSLGSATRSIGEASVFYILSNENKESDKFESENKNRSDAGEDVGDEKENKKHLSTALVLKFKFESIDNKINKIDYRRVQFDGIEKVLTVEQTDIGNEVRCSEKFKPVVKWTKAIEVQYGVHGFCGGRTE